MSSANYSLNVFINCPFDNEYRPLMDALVFSIYDCGHKPRCALEEHNSGNVRVDKIKKLILNSKFGIHDISRTELDSKSGFPRFNMPLELGVFLGAQFFGNKQQKNKNCLIIDSENYRYQSFISDIAGQDIRAHNSNPEQLIKLVRDWLHDANGGSIIIPGAKVMASRFNQFKHDLPKMCEEVKKEVDELTFVDRAMLISSWLTENPQFPTKKNNN